MKVGIVIFAINHCEYAYTLIKLFEREYSQIVLFLSKGLYTELSRNFEGVSSDVIFFVKDAEDSIYSFLKKNREVLNELDLFISDEIHFAPRVWRLPFIPKLKCYKILTLHNVNLWLKPKLKFNIKYFVKMLIRMYLLRTFDGISVFSNNMKRYVLQYTNYGNEVFVTPFSFFSNENKLINTENIKPFINITIPGMISKARRDYEKLLKIYERMLENNTLIKLVLLGKTIGEYGKKILDMCEDMNRRGGNIEFFRDYIPKEVFEKKIREADILYADIPHKFDFDGIKEIYGLTKETGITALMIKFSKPAILPISFQNIPELDNSIICYRNTKDLERILTNIDQKVIDELTRQAFINSRKFTIDQIRKWQSAICNSTITAIHPT